MNPVHDRVYRKTVRGTAALNTRAGALPARGRTALILVNGRDPLAALTGKIGPDAVVLVEMLLGMGLVEEVPPPPAPLRARPVVLPAAIDPATARAVHTRLAPLKREAVQRLAPQFGPDVDVVCGPLLAATTEDAYRTAIAAIETKLAIYLGRKGAQRMLDGLRI